MIKCPLCGGEINPAALLAATGRGIKKTMSPAAIAARTENAKKPRPGARKRKGEVDV